MDKKVIGGIVGAVVIVALLAVAASTVGKKDHASSMSNMPEQGQASESMMPAAGPNAVTIKSYAFGPKSLTVKAGTTVTWTNQDIARHNIVVDDGAPAGGPNGPLFGKGETFSFTFANVGTYAYHCDPHPYMHGTVVVTP